ncbi:MAG: TldD/PmbA family protein [Bdellovibrio sp.]
MSFAADSKKLFTELKTRLFNDLKEGEELNLNLNAEDTLFVRLNNARVRQNTEVEQRQIELVFQKNQKRLTMQTDLTGHLEEDARLCQSLVARARAETDILPEDPGATPFENRGTSQNIEDSREVNFDEILTTLQKSATGTDFTGLLTAGPQIRANANNKGQEHWFSTRSFFLDYSLFTVSESQENKAVKSTYADKEWSTEKFLTNLTFAKNQLAMLKRPSRDFKPGDTRVYLAPAAAAELIGMLDWNALSYGAYKKGQSAFAKMIDQKLKLSPLFSLRENFDLGLTTPFNSLGEVPSRQVNLIQQGELKQLLVSTRSAQQYGTESNFADSNTWGEESPRSLEVLPGQLATRDALKQLKNGLYLSNLHYCNWSDLQTARVTGMTRYACFLVENGEIVAPIKDLRFDVSLLSIFGAELEALTSESHIEPNTDTYFRRGLGGKKVPGMLINKYTFTL